MSTGKNGVHTEMGDLASDAAKWLDVETTKALNWKRATEPNQQGSGGITTLGQKARVKVTEALPITGSIAENLGAELPDSLAKKVYGNFSGKVIADAARKAEVKGRN